MALTAAGTTALVAGSLNTEGSMQQPVRTKWVRVTRAFFHDRKRVEVGVEREFASYFAGELVGSGKAEFIAGPTPKAEKPAEEHKPTVAKGKFDAK
jgi:hypothetical protein